MIGLIGYGRFGKLTLKALTPDFEVVVYTRNRDKDDDIKKSGAKPCSLETACAGKIVILCVPISAMQATLKQICPLLKPDALVVDVCSVKVLPVQWMKALLPEQVSILATHPMFGPDSAAESLKNHKIVLCPERVEDQRYAKIKKWLEDKGLVTIESTPEKHDRQIAVSLALTHFIGRSLSEFGAGPLAIDTEGYKRLLHILEVVTNDTWQLFEDMNRYNPFAKEKRQDFLDAMKRVNTCLEDMACSQKD
ncbi:MAG: prephenate dehydrogenase/arogenate dehydrogenase family protein [Desulfobacteraceae bacterium]|nr:prephenate dehydrogenase/arogenate dehydrogenase family protein [Desulfobacteraceae bacterium]